MKCFNKDEEGNCLAFNEANCREDCPARIPTLGDKIALLECLLARAVSRTDKAKLSKEIKETWNKLEEEKKQKFDGWASCYWEDVRRGERGGASESDSNRATALKTLMKDNRPVDVKPNRAQTEEYKEELRKWEEENGKLERLGRTGMSHSKVDSYTLRPICFEDSGFGTCRGQRSAAGNLDKDCRTCSYLKSSI